MILRPSHPVVSTVLVPSSVAPVHLNGTCMKYPRLFCALLKVTTSVKTTKGERGEGEREKVKIK
jgi:hypothetical protein